MASGDCELLKNLIIKITDFSKKYSNILDKDSAPLWNYAKENYNVTLDSILFNDILLWLGYLGLNDGEITEEELDFINYILDINFSKEDLLDHLDTNSIDDYEDALPTSFVVFYEFDRYMKENKSQNSGEISESLFNIYGGVGQLFLKLDCNSETDGEKDLKSAFEDYMFQLRQNLDDLKKFNYGLMVTSLNTELLEDIMNYNNFNKTLSKENLKIINEDMFGDGSSFNTDYMDVLNDIFYNNQKGLDEKSIDDSNHPFKDGTLQKFKEGLKNSSSFNPNASEDSDGRKEETLECKFSNKPYSN